MSTCSLANLFPIVFQVFSIVPKLICNTQDFLGNMDCLPNLESNLNIFKPNHKIMETSIHTDFYIFDSNSNCYNKFCKITTSQFNNSKVNYNKELVVLIHGFSRNYKDNWMREAAERLTKKKNKTVIALGWRVHNSVLKCSLNTNTYWYRSSADHVDAVAYKAAEFLANLTRPIGTWDHFHLVGHSLGAHIAGRIANNLKTDEIMVDRITGLDPALPRFRDSSSLRLNRSDAHFVDVIHTNSDPLEQFTLGIYEPLGHVDFYPDGGNHHNGCKEKNVMFSERFLDRVIRDRARDISSLLIGDPMPNLLLNLALNRDDLLCNHYKATEYFVSSIDHPSGCQFTACPKGQEKCKAVDQVKMGIDASNTKRNEKFRKSPRQFFISMKDLEKKCIKIIQEAGVNKL